MQMQSVMQQQQATGLLQGLRMPGPPPRAAARAGMGAGAGVGAAGLGDMGAMLSQLLGGPWGAWRGWAASPCPLPLQTRRQRTRLSCSNSGYGLFLPPGRHRSAAGDGGQRECGSQEAAVMALACHGAVLACRHNSLMSYSCCGLRCCGLPPCQRSFRGFCGNAGGQTVQ